MDHAAQCAEDELRTNTFHSAISTYLSEKAKVDILYVGPGPNATLLLPLLPNDSVRSIDLVEINPLSSNKLTSKIVALENITLHNCDVFSFTPSKEYDLIICEAMYGALIMEPQVAIIEHVRHWLKRGGQLIPEKVTVEANGSLAAVLNEEGFKQYSPELEGQAVLTTYVDVYPGHALLPGQSTITSEVKVTPRNSSETILKFHQGPFPKWSLECR